MYSTVREQVPQHTKCAVRVLAECLELKGIGVCGGSQAAKSA